MEINGINHITLSVRDLDKSFDFYKDTLNFTPKLRWKDGAYFLAGDLWFIIYVDEATRDTPLPEYSHIALNVSAKDFKSAAQAIKDSGAQIFRENKSEGDSYTF